MQPGKNYFSIDAGEAFDDLSGHFAMEDYNVLSKDSPQSEVADHVLALHIKNVAWAYKQMWAQNAAGKDRNTISIFQSKHLVKVSGLVLPWCSMVAMR